MPERFANHFSGKMSRSVKLEGPNCILYDVGVTEHRNRKVLQSGWEVFVDANDIVEKDSLMFRYRGSSRFKVAVFDSSGCEKTVSCFGIGSTMSDQEPITNSTEMSSSSSGRNTHSSVEDGCQSESSGHCRKLAWTDAASSPSEDLPGEDSPYEHESSGSDDDTLPKMISTVRVKEEQYSDASGRSDGCQNGSSSHSGSTRKTAVISTPSAESGDILK
uniref:TF-B3 domain-containing protein n=1 Tax=Aegilops tauschii subsp. strangulata TaxID=200361 RepID=A0A453HF44_AEGTS